MASQESSSRLKLDVTNFGPIDSAKIELRPLTVFVGPSNTGKSYMAMLIYALHRAVADIRNALSPNPDSVFRIVGLAPWHDSNRVPDHVTEELLAWAKGSFEQCHASQSAILETKPLPASFASTIDDVVWGADEVSASIRQEIVRCFGVTNLSSLIRRDSGFRSSVDIRMVSARLDELLRLNLEIERECLSTRGTTSTSAPIRTTAQESPWIHLKEAIENIDRAMQAPCSTETRKSRSHEQMVTQWLTSELVLPHVLGSLGHNAYYIPAERSGIIHTYPVLMKAMIASNATVGMRPTPRALMLSGMLSDFLEALISVRNKAKEEDNSIDFFGRMIEEKMLGGTIHIEQDPVGYPSFTYRPTDRKEHIPLMQTSSMVSELTPIVLYLQWIVREGDLLIIEEPESRIHPRMQVMIAKVIAELVRHGVRVIVTTHSDWFIDQIGNLVMLSGIPSEGRHEITDGTALGNSEVGVWQFEKVGKDGSSQVTEIDVDPDTGLYPVDFGRVSDSLYNESAYIFNRLQKNDYV